MALLRDESMMDLKSMRDQDLPPSPPDTEDNVSTTSDTTDFPLPPPSTVPERVLDIDKKTPDHHVPRDPRLIRLTGVHPFNVEAPLSALYDEGFLTTPELSYVRNHGPVPEVYDADCLDWEFSVEGMVERPFTLTLRALMSEFQQVTYPITLVCAGNRRKEQNQVRKSKGFSWGSAGLYTSLFTGVAMAEVIRRAKPTRKARFVCMEGADQLPNGFYGTSVKLNWAMDPNRGIMLAYQMNGERLRPDHGKPLRAVVPGQIGGRSVKWLKKLIITAEPSDNWYHIFDNRVLPTMVSPEESASNPDWWKDDRYAIYDLSVNSAIAYPAHEERVSLIDAAESYRAQGYAYSGGGRRVTRVELSLDQGRTWRLANIHYAEDTYRDADPRSLFGGKVDVSWRETCFCWCFWSLDIPLPELASAPDLLVRAMDEAMNVQPRDMYWSVLGMMNNPWFRIVITNDPSTSSLRFEHPTQPALMPGGWMERVKTAGGDLANGFWGEHTGSAKPAETIIVEDVVMTNPTALAREITLADFRLHEEAAHPWFVMQGQVYDGTSFLKKHPGGAQSIISAAAQDSTDEFMAIHSETAKAMMPRHHIGYLSAESLALLAEPSSEATSDYTLENNPVFLHPRHWFSCTLISRQIISHDTRLFTYSLSHPSQRLGLPVGQHLMVRLRSPITQETLIRSYTPISCPSRKGQVQLLVKVYFDSADGTTKGGKMSQALDALEVGKQLECKGPIGKFEYIGKGLCRISGTERKVRKFGMICAGTGVTPIFQVLRAVVEEREGGVKVTVLSGNRGIEDILCKKEMDEYEREVCEREMDGKAGEKRVRIVYTLTKPPRDWMGRKGRITRGMVEDEGLKPDGQTMILICGPSALEKSLETSLKEKGWKDEDFLFF